MPPDVHFDFTKLDFTKLLVDKEAIHKLNPQRFEMDQLDGIVYMDTVENISVGFKDVREDEFWVRGHMPGYPLMPGVLICEAAAQLCSYLTKAINFFDSDFLGFGGMENVRFRNSVFPGQRLVLVSKVVKLHRRQVISNVQGFVGDTMVFNGDIIGVPLNRKSEE